jgi:hypothetical protein
LSWLKLVNTSNGGLPIFDTVESEHCLEMLLATWGIHFRANNRPYLQLLRVLRGMNPIGDGSCEKLLSPRLPKLVYSANAIQTLMASLSPSHSHWKVRSNSKCVNIDTESVVCEIERSLRFANGETDLFDASYRFARLTLIINLARLRIQLPKCIT